MKAKKIMPAFLLLFLSTLFWLWSGGEKLSEEKSKEREKKSLIRKDLLLRKERKLELPLRNIFSPRKPGRKIGKTGSDTVETQQNFQGTEAESEKEISPTDFSIRYIGYIDSGQRIVALIIFEGEALAVEMGEMISEEVRVGNITREEIEIIGPESESRKYYLEGENQ